MVLDANNIQGASCGLALKDEVPVLKSSYTSEQNMDSNNHNLFPDHTTHPVYLQGRPYSLFYVVYEDAFLSSTDDGITARKVMLTKASWSSRKPCASQLCFLQ